MPVVVAEVVERSVGLGSAVVDQMVLPTCHEEQLTARAEVMVDVGVVAGVAVAVLANLDQVEEPEVSGQVPVVAEDQEIGRAHV